VERSRPIKARLVDSCRRADAEPHLVRLNACQEAMFDNVFEKLLVYSARGCVSRGE
jgi:hypothetical protein